MRVREPAIAPSGTVSKTTSKESLSKIERAAGLRSLSYGIAVYGVCFTSGENSSLRPRIIQDACAPHFRATASPIHRAFPHADCR